MNSNNYGSREACEKLFKAGVVLETEHCWYPSIFLDKWLLKNSKWKDGKKLPAPSMAEVWRKLPEEAILHIYFDSRGTVIEYRLASLTICVAKTVYDTNPTDALIDLLIWVRKEGT